MNEDLIDAACLSIRVKGTSPRNNELEYEVLRPGNEKVFGRAGIPIRASLASG